MKFLLKFISIVFLSVFTVISYSQSCEQLYPRPNDGSLDLMAYARGTCMAKQAQNMQRQREMQEMAYREQMQQVKEQRWLERVKVTCKNHYSYSQNSYVACVQANWDCRRSNPDNFRNCVARLIESRESDTSNGPLE